MKTYKLEIEVLNFNENALKYPYIIVRYCDGQVWYYGADSLKERAYSIAEELGNGFVIKNENIIK